MKEPIYNKDELLSVKWWDAEPDTELAQFVENTLDNPTAPEAWDRFFMAVAQLASEMSKCGSRGIGAVLVKEKQILSFGYNGSPMGSSLCQCGTSCPRRKLGIPSGAGLELCPAQHAEENCIHNAAMNGISTLGSTLYCYCGIPCQRCAGALINAGVYEVVALNRHVYDSLSARLFREAGVTVRYLSEEVEDVNKRV